MRLLWVAPYSPHPPIHGGRIRQLGLLTETLRRGHHIDLWVIGDTEVSEPVDPSHPLHAVRQRTFKGRRRQTPTEKMRAFLSPLPEAAWILCDDEVQAAFVGALKDYDAVVLCQANLGPLAVLAARAGLPVVVDAQNVESELTAQMARRATRWRRRFRLRGDAAKFRRLEAATLRAASVVACVSEEDAELLRSLAPEARLAVVPSAVDRAAIPFADHTAVRANALLYVGSLGYPPNIDAVSWLAEDILPRVRERVPDVQLDIVGAGPPEQVRRLHDPERGIRVHGGVPEIGPHLRAADVFVMPLRMGSGTRLKALEAMCAGIPIVSTRLGVQGLGLTDGTHVLLGESADDLARAVVRALSEPSLRRSMTKACDRHVDEHFSLAATGVAFSAALEAAVRGTD